MTRFYSRDDWGAAPPKSTPNSMNSGAKGMVVIHHTVTAYPDSPATAQDNLRTIQGWHQGGNGWNDIGYNYIIGCGDSYEGRGWGVVGAQAENFNYKSHGIAVLMDGSAQEPHMQDLQAIADTINAGIAAGWVDGANLQIVCHGDLNSTACPGSLRGYIPTIVALVNGGVVPTPTPDPTPSGVWGYGDVGPEVARIQGIVGVPADGIWGPVTDGAVRAWQFIIGTTVDGLWGPETERLTQKELGGGGGGSDRPMLAEGDNGGDVYDLQQRLNEVAGAGLAVDGIFGPLTARAVRWYQASVGLVADGIVGPLTWGALGI
jgi:peptidoglycan hydrolase-like protein with peptidoglycan-binding domain